MLNKFAKFSTLFATSFLLLAFCAGCGKKADEPFFKLRGVILCWDDIKNPDLMKKNGLNTISVCGHPYDSPEYYEFRQKCIDAGLDFEYEEHAMSWLLPRELFATHPEYFRMDENGVRQSDGNGCPSCQEGLEVLMSNVPEFVRTH